MRRREPNPTSTAVVCCLAAALTWSGPGLAQAPEEQSIAIPLSDPARPVVLEVSLQHGSVEVLAREGAEVLVEAVREPEEEEIEEVDGMFRIPNSSMGLVLAEEDNRVEVDGDWGSDVERLTIRVPRRTSAHVDSMHGDILVRGVTGHHELSSVNGEITADGVSGSVVADTTNGDVTVRFVEVDPEKPMSFSSWNGDLDTTFPAGFGARLRMSSAQGEIYSDVQVALDSAPPQLVREEHEKGSRIEVERAVRGTIGGGGPEIRYETYNGDIYIRSGG